MNNDVIKLNLNKIEKILSEFVIMFDNPREFILFSNMVKCQGFIKNNYFKTLEEDYIFKGIYKNLMSNKLESPLLNESLFSVNYFDSIKHRFGMYDMQYLFIIVHFILYHYPECIKDIYSDINFIIENFFIKNKIIESKDKFSCGFVEDNDNGNDNQYVKDKDVNKLNYEFRRYMISDYNSLYLLLKNDVNTVKYLLIIEEYFEFQKSNNILNKNTILNVYDKNNILFKMVLKQIILNSIIRQDESLYGCMHFFLESFLGFAYLPIKKDLYINFRNDILDLLTNLMYYPKFRKELFKTISEQRDFGYSGDFLYEKSDRKFFNYIDLGYINNDIKGNFVDCYNQISTYILSKIFYENDKKFNVGDILNSISFNLCSFFRLFNIIKIKRLVKSPELKKIGNIWRNSYSSFPEDRHKNLFDYAYYTLELKYFIFLLIKKEELEEEQWKKDYNDEYYELDYYIMLDKRNNIHIYFNDEELELTLHNLLQNIDNNKHNQKEALEILLLIIFSKKLNQDYKDKLYNLNDKRINNNNLEKINFALEETIGMYNNVLKKYKIKRKKLDDILFIDKKFNKYIKKLLKYSTY